MPILPAKGLNYMFGSLPFLEDLVLDDCQNVPDSGPTVEFLGSQCKNLRSLKLGQFHNILQLTAVIWVNKSYKDVDTSLRRL
jgi:hypothetical protein